MNTHAEASSRMHGKFPLRDAGIACALGLVAAASVARAGDASPDNSQGNLADMSIEQLLNEPVTSVSKKDTNLFQSPEAIAVVTDDDISRMDFTSIPEALRFVPGVDVARIDGSSWAVSVRGSNSQFANDTLVLIDGRTIYEASFGGVYWKTQEIPMQDIDRIEVVLGPGSTLWGANALNGVINVISKSAQETQGLLTTVNEGTEDDPSATLRYGGKLGNSVFYRAYVTYFNKNGLDEPDGADAEDFSHGWRTGFRLDATTSATDTFTLEGDAFDISTGESVSIPDLVLASNQLIDVISQDHGEDLLGKWVRKTSEASQWSVQAFYDHYNNTVGITEEKNDTLDFEFQDRFPIGSNQDIVTGFGFRGVRNTLPPSANVMWNPELDLIHLYSAFLQDQVTVIPGVLSLIPGTKLEHNDVTGFEFEPGTRLLWTPVATQTFWLGATRAVRTPALTETAAQFAVTAFPTSPGGPPAEVVLEGNPDIDRSEKVDAYDAGYRIQPTHNLSFDFAVFYDVNHDLIVYGPAVSQFVTAPLPPHLLLISTTDSGGTGASYGGEFSVLWKVTDAWRLAADYSLLRSKYSPDDSESEDSPRNQAHLRSFLNLPHGLELNGAVGFVGRIVDTESVITQPVPSYFRVDLGLVWRPSPSLEIGVWGQNLTAREHLEFGSQLTTVVSEVPRGIATRITWHH
jgi:iron complex outermembrane receptor protein